MKYRVENKSKTVLFPYLHDALAYLNTLNYGKLYEASTGRLIDSKNPDRIHEAQLVLSNIDDRFNRTHQKIEDLINKAGPLLEDEIYYAMERSEVLHAQSKDIPYIRALTHFLIIRIGKEGRNEIE